MTFSDSFILDAKLTEAKAECDSASGRLDALSESIGKRLDGQNRSKLISVIAGTLLLAAFYVTAYVFLRRYVEYGYYEYLMIIGNKLAPWTLIASLALIGVMLFDRYILTRYYGKVLQFQTSADNMKKRLERGKTSLDAHQSEYMEQKERSWDLPLSPGSSIYNEIDQINTSLAGLEAVRSGPLTMMKNVLYYVTALLWTGFGSSAVVYLGCNILTMFNIYYISETWFLIALVIAVVGEILLTKYAWGRSGAEVKNTTLFATVAGLVIFLTAIALGGLIVLLAKLVWELLKFIGIAILAVIVGGALCAGLSGG